MFLFMFSVMVLRYAKENGFISVHRAAKSTAKEKGRGQLEHRDSNICN